jgi:hypothetical protein
MLRVPQHERNNVKDIKSPPFVLSLVEGLREHSQQSAQDRYCNHAGLSTQRSEIRRFLESLPLPAPVAAALFAIPLRHAFPFLTVGANRLPRVDGFLK